MTVITDYASLQDAVNVFLNRPDLVGSIPLLIQLGEDEIKTDILRDAVSSTVNFTVDAATLFYAFPSDYEGVLSIYQTGRGEVFYYPKSEFDNLVQNTQGGQIYTIGDGGFLFAPWLGGATVNIDYMKAFVNLSDASPTSVLLTKYPSLYLWATLKCSALLQIEDERVQVWQASYEKIVAAINLKIVELLTPTKTMKIKRFVV